MYCSHLWSDFKNDTLRRLIVGYNHSVRIIMKYHLHCSASGMFVSNGVPSFIELWRKSMYGFKQRVDNSLNKDVNTVANTSLLSSKLRKHWRTVHFTGGIAPMHMLYIYYCIYIIILWVMYVPEIKLHYYYYYYYVMLSSRVFLPSSYRSTS